MRPVNPQENNSTTSTKRHKNRRVHLLYWADGGWHIFCPHSGQVLTAWGGKPQKNPLIKAEALGLKIVGIYYAVDARQHEEFKKFLQESQR